MKLAVTTLLVFAFTIECAIADTAVNINKGEPAPYTGVLLDLEKAEKIRDELIDKDTLQKTNESLNKSILLYKSNEEILSNHKNLLLNQNMELTKTLNDTRETSGWVKAAYFVLGMAATGAAVHFATKLTR